MIDDTTVQAKVFLQIIGAIKEDPIILLALGSELDPGSGFTC